jgi:hypothetical protein
MSDEMVKNLKKPSAWFRVLFMAGFVIALYVTGVILLVLMLAQIVFSLLAGESNINLRRLGAGLANYVSQILTFLTYNSEQKPFPFLPFPLPESAQSDDVAAPYHGVESHDEQPDLSKTATPRSDIESAAQSSVQATTDTTIVEQQAIADDDGFQNVSNSANTPDDVQAPPASDQAAAPNKRSPKRKQKITDPEAPHTDD